MAINERLIHTASDSTSEVSGNQEEGLILHLDANDVDSYDGTGTVWYDISDHEFTPSENPEEHFNIVTWTGDGSTGRSITGLGFQPDLVWIKKRTNDEKDHRLFDSVRGQGNVIYPNQVYVEASPTNELTSFDSDGFTVGNASAVNDSSSADTYVAWCMKAGGAPTATNTGGQNPTSGSKMIDGSADDTAYPTADQYPNKLSANTKLGFSIVDYTASLTSTPAAPGRSIPHGLNQPPEMIIWKSPDREADWWVSHKETPTYSHLFKLNNSNMWSDYYSSYPIGPPTNDVFYTSYITGMQHVAGEKIMAYCFHSVRGVSKVGNYNGTGTSGNFIHTGFEPAWVMIKQSTASGYNWNIFDNKRNSGKAILGANTRSVEDANSGGIDFNRDGFTINNTYNYDNQNGVEFIYLAFAKNTNETELATTTSGVWSGFQSAVSSITSDSTSTTSAPGINESSTTSSMFNQTNYWSMGDNGTSEASNEIFITLNAAKSIKGYAVYEMYQSNYRYTGTTKLYGSTDNSNWYLLGSTVQTTSVQYNRNETTFAATPEYQYYKLTMSVNSRGTYQGAWELEFLVDEDITPNLHLDAASYSGSGSTWTADVGNDGTITGATYNDELGNYFDFDGNDSITSAGNLSVPNENFTVEFWTRPDSTSTSQNFFEIEDTSGNRRVSMVVNTGSAFRCYIYEASGFNNSSFPTSTTTFDTGKWYHVAVTFEKGVAAKMYINGELDVTSTTNISAARPTTYGETNIGTGAFGSLTGAIGQFRFYNIVLSAEAIRQNFNYTKSSYPNGMHFVNAGGRANWLPEGSFNFDTGQSGGEYLTPSSSRSFNNNIGRGPFAVSAWVYPDEVTSSWRVIIGTSGYSDGSNNGWQLYANQDDIKFWISVGSGYEVVTLNSVLTASTWTHVFIQRTETQWEGYIDGQLVSNASSNSTQYINDDIGMQNSGDSKLIIGRNWQNTNYQWDGRISEVKIYNKSLSADKIQAEYNKGQFGDN